MVSERCYALRKRIIIWLFCLSILCWSVRWPGSLSADVYAAGYGCGSGNHDYNILTHDASEYEDGEIIYSCILCGYEYIEILPATRHVWGEWVIEKEATCVDDGLRVRTCSRNLKNLHTEEQVVPALLHDYEETIIPAGCENGECKVYVCKRCGDSYEEILGEGLGHDYREEILVFADCETDGIRAYVCERCQDGYTEVILASGHDYGEWIVDKEPTKNESGRRHRVCANNSAHILEEKMDKLPTASDINAFDVIIYAVGAGGVATFGFFIFDDYRIILWDYRKRKRRLRKKKEGGGRKQSDSSADR